MAVGPPTAQVTGPVTRRARGCRLPLNDPRRCAIDYEAHEGRMQTGRRTAHAGSGLKPLTTQEGTAWKASLPAVLGKPAVRNDRDDRGNVGIIRSPIRALDPTQLPLAD